MSKLGERVLAMRDAGRSWTQISEQLEITVAQAKEEVAEPKRNRRDAVAKDNPKRRTDNERCSCGHVRVEHHESEGSCQHLDTARKYRWDRGECHCREFEAATADPKPYPNFGGRYASDAKTHAWAEEIHAGIPVERSVVRSEPGSLGWSLHIGSPTVAKRRRARLRRRRLARQQ